MWRPMEIYLHDGWPLQHEPEKQPEMQCHFYRLSNPTRCAGSKFGQAARGIYVGRDQWNRVHLTTRQRKGAQTWSWLAPADGEESSHSCLAALLNLFRAMLLARWKLSLTAKSDDSVASSPVKGQEAGISGSAVPALGGSVRKIRRRGRRNRAGSSVHGGKHTKAPH
jgi:hypothetical protein